MIRASTFTWLFFSCALMSVHCGGDGSSSAGGSSPQPDGGGADAAGSGGSATGGAGGSSADDASTPGKDASSDGAAGSPSDANGDASDVDAGLLYAFTFEGTNPIMEDHGAFELAQENEESPDDLSVVADPNDPGNQVRKYTLHASDTLDECGECQRVEDKIYYADWRAEMGHEYWYGFRTMIRSSEWGLGANDVGGDRWLTIAQWHDIPDYLYYGIDEQQEEWKHPTLAITVINGKYKILSRMDAQEISVPLGGEWGDFDARSIGCSAAYDWQGQNDQPPGPGCRWWEYDMTADRAAGRWVSWVVHVLWAWDETGLLQVWKDGELLVDEASYPTSYNDYAGPTVKFGDSIAVIPYDGAQYQDRALYVDEYRVGDATASYATVAPRGGN